MQHPAKEIEHVVHVLLAGRIAERQKVIETCFTEDVEFDHPLVKLRGRRELFDLYQFWHQVNLKLSFKLPKVVVSPETDRIVLDVDEFIQPFLLPFMRPVIRLVVFLDLQKTPKGYKISRQEDHIVWSESILRTIPGAHNFWHTYITRASGLSIVYLMKAAGHGVNLLATHVLPHLSQNSALRRKAKGADDQLDTRLIQKWSQEEERLKYKAGSSR